MKYIRLYADEYGISRFEDVEELLSPLDFAPPAPALNLSSFFPAARLAFMEAPIGWYGKQHPAPRRQFFFLSGVFEVTSGSGETRCFNPGNILLMEDITGKGHTTKVVGTKTAFAAVVQLP